MNASSAKQGSPLRIVLTQWTLPGHWLLWGATSLLVHLTLVAALGNGSQDAPRLTVTQGESPLRAQARFVALETPPPTKVLPAKKLESAVAQDHKFHQPVVEPMPEGPPPEAIAEPQPTSETAPPVVAPQPVEPSPALADEPLTPAPLAMTQDGADVHLAASGQAGADSREVPDALVSPAPSYPPAAIRRNIEGSVHLSVTVDERGLPVRVELAQTSGFSPFDREAIRTVSERWRFACNGRPSERPFDVVINFTLRR